MKSQEKLQILSINIYRVYIANLIKIKNNQILKTVCFLFIVLLTGCKGESKDIREEIFSYTEQHCTLNNQCVFSLGDLTSFEWDKAYIFDKGKSRQSIEKIIGIPYPDYQDIGEKFIFIKDNKIAYANEYYLNYDDAENDRKLRVDFSCENNKNSHIGYFYITHDNNQLSINFTKEDNKSLFLLKPLNAQQYGNSCD